MTIFPIYLLRFGKNWTVVFPDERADIGHTDFWEQTVSHIVAKHYRIPQKNLLNLPYCQRRARVIGNNVFYGGKHDPALLQSIRKALGDNSLVLAQDDHEKRLRADVLEFRRLVLRHRAA